MADPDAVTLAVDLAPEATAIANAVAAVFKMGDAIFETLNSPQMLAYRRSADIQAAIARMDDTLKAAQGGDKGALKKLDAEVSG